MALKATILRANIQLSDMDRNYYDTLQLTLAQHPSETNDRLIIRLMAFILNASPELKFGRGVSDEDEAAIWEINYSEEILLWIELGQIDIKRLKKACNKANEVKLYCYGSSASIWWQQNKQAISQFENLVVEQFSQETSEILTQLVSRSMDFQCSIQDGQLWLTSADESYLIETIKLTN